MVERQLYFNATHTKHVGLLLEGISKSDADSNAMYRSVVNPPVMSFSITLRLSSRKLITLVWFWPAVFETPALMEIVASAGPVIHFF